MSENEFLLMGPIIAMCAITALAFIKIVSMLFFEKMKVLDFLCACVYFILSICSAFTLEKITKMPSAMEYHQGKTAIQYTTSEGIPSDSIIVFKRSYKKH